MIGMPVPVAGNYLNISIYQTQLIRDVSTLLLLDVVIVNLFKDTLVLVFAEACLPKFEQGLQQLNHSVD